MQYSESYLVQELEEVGPSRKREWVYHSEWKAEHDAWAQFDRLGDLMDSGSIRIVRVSEVIIGTRSKS
jgi:hypothetical protein